MGINDAFRDAELVVAALDDAFSGKRQLIGAMQRNQEAMDGFISVQANTLPAPEFFAPENVGRIIGGAAVAG